MTELKVSTIVEILPKIQEKIHKWINLREVAPGREKTKLCNILPKLIEGSAPLVHYLNLDISKPIEEVQNCPLVVH